MSDKLNAYTLRRISKNSILPSPKTKNIYLILDNVLDTYNIGGLFRLAEALGVKRLFICGETADTPPNPRIQKASIGTHHIVPWQYFKTASEAILTLKNEVPNISIVAIEQAESSENLYESNFTLPIAIVVGNETHGCCEATLSKCDKIIEIPMWGANISLNVIVSAGIAGFEVMRQNIHL